MSNQPDKKSLDARPLPPWFSDAKLGVFIHWGLYSVPAFAENTDGDFATYMADLSSGEDDKAGIPYAEWYLNSLRTPDSATARHHLVTYGADFSYYDFRAEFEANAAEVDFDEWATLFSTVGAEYVVMVTRHLDGYPLWPTTVPNPKMPPGFHSPRDLVGDLSSAVRRRGLRMGLYYAGGIDWTFTDQPIETMTDLLEQSSLGPEYAAYVAAQWRELVNRYQPSVLWNDMGMPEEIDPHQLFADYYAAVPDGVVNDRWEQVDLPDNSFGREVYLDVLGFALRMMHRFGKKVPVRKPEIHSDFRTHEYTVPENPPAARWELTRGLGESFGFNAAETAADLLSGPELVRLFADVLGRGGNLLINVGPDGSGRIPEVQQRPLLELGTWLRANRAAVYGTEPLPGAPAETSDGVPVRFTRRGDDIFAIVLADEVAGRVVFPNITPVGGSRAHVLASETEIPWRVSGSDVEVELPPLDGSPAHVVAFTV
ncbi:alpha-L-fucosidase [Nocardia sp. A7]|uniref:alpha-L-fucosidase n=1 Tax=Nocardia sp. A7 TaxID=2789274 RepID=UPI00397CF4B5